jgi:hypothetical protein
MGDIGPDGRIFYMYRKESKNGEHWKTKEQYEKLFKTVTCLLCKKEFKNFRRKTIIYCSLTCRSTHRVRKTIEERESFKKANPSRKLKKGDIDKDGRVFFGYKTNCKNGEYWITKEQFKRYTKLYECEYCKKEFRATIHRKRRFCSDPCAHSFDKNKYLEVNGLDGKRNQSGSLLAPARKCLYCNEEFRPLLTSVRSNKGKFCTHICSVKYLTETRAKKKGFLVDEKYGKRHLGKEVNCFNCNKLFFKPIGRIREKLNFCSHPCRGEYQTGINNHSYKADRVSHKNKIDYSKACRAVLNQTLKGYMSVKRSKELLGYDRKLLRSHIESLFHSGMSWDNYGTWHIDHIIPVHHYWETDPNTPFFVVNALSNLQPLFELDNLKKGHKTSFSKTTQSV